ncbi:hypothetical protein CSUI_010563 [Cystoisospora suis]|uniref:Transmembrane protein n=1 Tax=Cystoisospora suis TaxID=483139 RepID=A0A2C6KGM0_9APIC|nr:hypothetical protein CSUI_010563 [Cystoisospora suis]
MRSVPFSNLSTTGEINHIPIYLSLSLSLCRCTHAQCHEQKIIEKKANAKMDNLIVLQSDDDMNKRRKRQTDFSLSLSPLVSACTHALFLCWHFLSFHLSFSLTS